MKKEVAAGVLVLACGVLAVVPLVVLAASRAGSAETSDVAIPADTLVRDAIARWRQASTSSASPSAPAPQHTPLAALRTIIRWQPIPGISDEGCLLTVESGPVADPSTIMVVVPNTWCGR